MKKIFLVLLAIMMMCGIVACGAEKIELHCDGENCDNIVLVTQKGEDTPDESWVIYCKECAENVLGD